MATPEGWHLVPCTVVLTITLNADPGAGVGGGRPRCSSTAGGSGSVGGRTRGRTPSSPPSSCGTVCLPPQTDPPLSATSHLSFQPLSPASLCPQSLVKLRPHLSCTPAPRPEPALQVAVGLTQPWLLARHISSSVPCPGWLVLAPRTPPGPLSPHSSTLLGTHLGCVCQLKAF